MSAWDGLDSTGDGLGETSKKIKKILIDFLQGSCTIEKLYTEGKSGNPREFSRERAKALRTLPKITMEKRRKVRYHLYV